MQIHKEGRIVTLCTRNGADWTERFPHLAAALTSLPCKSAIIDAELVHAHGFERLHRQVLGASKTTWCCGRSTSCSSTATTCAPSISRTANDDLAIW